MFAKPLVDTRVLSFNSTLENLLCLVRGSGFLFKCHRKAV